MTTEATSEDGITDAQSVVANLSLDGVPEPHSQVRIDTSEPGRPSRSPEVKPALSVSNCAPFFQHMHATVRLSMFRMRQSEVPDTADLAFVRAV